MTVRPVRGSDKKYVLDFCRGTFGWGDYIDDDVWNSWCQEGIFLACDQYIRARQEYSVKPVGICHAYLSGAQVWVEGIRVNPEYRRCGIATRLVRAAECAALERGCTVSRMLIDANNAPSLHMAEVLGYVVADTWIYCKMELGEGESEPDGLSDVHIHAAVDPAVCTHYVRSWRWHETDDAVLRRFTSEGMTAAAASDADDVCGATYVIMTVQPSLGGPGRTLSGTLYPGSDRSVARMLAFLRERAVHEDCASINVFVRRRALPALHGVRGKFTFCLVEKPLQTDVVL